MSENYIIAIEIGTGSVKAAAALAEDRSATMLALESEPLNRSVRYGRILNVEEVSNALCVAIDNLSNSPEVAPRSIVGAYVGVGGRSLHTLRVSAHLTLPEEQEITFEIIEHLKDTAIAEVPDNMFLLRVIPLRFTVDGVPTQRPKGTYGTRITGEFTVIVCNPNNIRQIERVVGDRLGLDICGWVVRPLAIARTVLTPDDAQLGSMLVDMGAETTTVTIVKDGSVQYINTIPVGSDHITGDIATGLGVTRQMAEVMKMSQASAVPEPSVDDTREQIDLSNYVCARAEEIADNVIAHIGYAGLQPDDLRAGIIMTGRGSRLRSMGTLLEKRSNLRVRQASLPSWMHVAVTDINPNDYIDIISCLVDGGRQQESHPGELCVKMPEPKVEPKEEPKAQPTEKVVEEKREEKVEQRPNPYAGGQTFKIDEGEGEDIDDDEVLLDDDEVDRRRQQERIRRDKEAARRQAENDARYAKQAATIDEDELSDDTEDDVPKSNRWGGYFKKMVGHIFKDGEGSDMNDDE